jgi:hypothetical protein
MQPNGKFYLGRTLDSQQPVHYDPADLTTHAVVVGMTGSGKTGLCIDLLEEAALNGVPALMIDPKGDITNALLHFPDLLPADFQPWINPDDARRAGKSLQQAAEDTANAWKQGLAKWEIGPERIRALSNAAHFAVYTPGSEAGLPVSILANLQAPQLPWKKNRQLLREKISATVTAILGLVGLEDIDPVSSREHILLSNIFEFAWSQGRDLDLSELILQTQNPPLDKLGVFDVDTVFPEKERFELAMTLNNILAAPAFQPWIEGQLLEIPSLLYGPDGRPRHSVFYIAHLNDAERMFFVALLYAAVETWMRAQPGTSSLRALVYFDEIFGYVPPIRNPASKAIMLRMLKQGRAFGVGQVLATQNPVDIDYKGLSNAGTWFIGKLQTENDKERLLDGLQGASPGLDRRHYDDLISTLDKRVFLLHNIHAPEPLVFKTRWAMNYLAGPLTRAQIPQLNALVGAGPAPEGRAPAVLQADSAPRDASAPPGPAPAIGSTTRPSIPTGIEEYFLPNNLTVSQAAKAAQITLPADARSLGLLYRPVLLAQAEVRFLQRKYDLDYETARTALITEPDRRGTARWENWLTSPIDPSDLESKPAPGATFATLEKPLEDGKMLRALERDFVDWIYHSLEVSLRANEELEVYAGPDSSQAAFRRTCAGAARQHRDEELLKVEDSYEKKLKTIQDRMLREERELRSDEAELRDRRLEEYGTHAENLLSLLSRRRRRLSTSLTKRRLTEKAKVDVEESLAVIEEYERQINDLEAEKEQALQGVKDKWAEIADDMTTIPVRPYKKDILVDLFGVAWVPYHLVEAAGQHKELPGFASG